MTSLARISGCPRSENQHSIGARNLCELLRNNLTGPKCDLQESSERLCCWVLKIHAEEPIPAQNLLFDQPRFNQPLSLPMNGGARHSNPLRKIGQTELTVWVEKQPCEQLGLSLAAKDGQQCRSLGSHK